MTGTFINAATVVIASTAGMALGSRLPDKVRETAMHGLGLATILFGMQMALKTQNILVVLGSIILGGVTGELLHIEDGLDRFGNWIEPKIE